MGRERALKVVLTLLGVLCLATAYPLLTTLRTEPAVAMMLSLYFTLGVFLLLAVRNPSAHRGLIGFTAWSSFAHAGVMSTQTMLHVFHRSQLPDSAVLVVVGIILLALLPAKQAEGLASAAGS